MFEITSGVINKAKKVVFYGVEGVGKSTFAAHFPDPLFIDTEGSTANMNVRRYPKPSSWQMLNDEIIEIMNIRPCKTLIIDTADWAERLCMESVCSAYGKKGIEDFGYGNGWTYGEEEWGRFLNLLQDVVDIADINVVLTAHSCIRKFELPNEMGAYDKYELKLGKKTTSKTAPLTKEWADMVLFANFKTYVVAVDKDGKKHKAQGKDRVMYTTHHPCWDAKNRYNLPEEMPLDFSGIAHLFEEKEQIQQSNISHTSAKKSIKKIEQLGSELESIIKEVEPEIKPQINSRIPKPLLDLMEQNLVTEDEIKKAVALKGYYPAETPIENYDINFINGVLVGAWPQVLNIIENQIREF